MASREPTRSKVIISGVEVVRIIDRLAHQILEKSPLSGNRGIRDETDAPEPAGTVLLGLPTRGVPLAHRLATRIAAFAAISLPVGVLDTTLYRDDLPLRAARALGPTDVPLGGVQGRRVIIVDDVLYSGRTVRAALEALAGLGRPAAVQLAVLVDRGHRELPIRADFVGKNLPTSRAERVRVMLAETDGVDEVRIDAADLAASR